MLSLFADVGGLTESDIAGVDCDQIDGEMLDDVVMGRSTDSDLIAHIGSCPQCSVRFADQHAWADDLRTALGRARLNSKTEEV